MIATFIYWFLTVAETCLAEGDQKGEQPPSEWQGYSIAFRVLLPVAGLLYLWGRRDLFNKLMVHFDRSGVSVFCPSFSQRQKLLNWIAENLPSTRSPSSKTLEGGIPDLWKDGSILCTLINMAVPGACQNPPKHWKKPPTHAQALAYKYLGVIPVFIETDFDDPFDPTQERKFLLYLQELQQAVKSKITKELPNKFSQVYLAKGMGLYNGIQHKKSTFYIYSNNTSQNNCNNVLVYIRGPYGTQGTATVPAFYNRTSFSPLNSLHRQYRSFDGIILKRQPRKSFLMSIASDISSLVNRKQISNDIPVHIEMETNRAKVVYIPLNDGVYEIDLITNGELLVNSPYVVSVSENHSDIRETLDPTEDILHELPTMKKRRIVARYIDCIDEKIQLENEDSDVLSTTDESGFDSFLESSIPDLPEAQVEEETVANDEDLSVEPTENLTINNFSKSVTFAEDKPSSSSNMTPQFQNRILSDTKQQNRSDSAISLDPIDLCEATTEESPRTFDSYAKLEPWNIKEDDPKDLIDSSGVTSEVEVFDLKKSDFGAEDRVQKRPTSIVTPFLISHNAEDNMNDLDTSEGREERYLKHVEVASQNSYLANVARTKEPVHQNGLRQNNYVDHLKAILVNKFSESNDAKTIKNIVNTSNKLKDMWNPHRHDENNNNFERRSLSDTSPVCYDHIAPEVDEANFQNPKFVSVAERRKLLSKQSCFSLPSSNNTSFSEKENGDVSKSFDENYSLRVLSVIDTLRNSANPCLDRTISSSTPNISTKCPSSIRSTSEGNEDIRTSYTEIRDYWLNLSSCSIDSERNYGQSGLRQTQQKFRAISSEKYKSAEDISSISRLNFRRKLTKCMSLNQKDFQSIEFVSLEERKKMLLQNQYETEKMTPRFLRKNKFYATKSTDSFLVVQKKEEKDLRRSLVNETNTMEIKTDKEENIRGLQDEQKTSKPSTQFKRAFNFFKNLEKSDSHKGKQLVKPKPQIKRRFSLDSFQIRKEKERIGGSLSLPKTDEKFSISRIYSDIVENKRGSFKGTPNKEALLDSLTSLSTTTNDLSNCSEDTIKYNIFVNKTKSRKRKSLKSIFNVLY